MIPPGRTKKAPLAPLAMPGKSLDHALPGACTLEQSQVSRLPIRRIKRMIALPHGSFSTLRVAMSARHGSFVRSTAWCENMMKELTPGTNAA
jgi:hypothetical protein